MTETGPGLGHGCILLAVFPCQRRRPAGDRRPHLTAVAPSPSTTPGPERGDDGRASAEHSRGLHVPSEAALAGGAASGPAVSLGRSCQTARPGLACLVRGSPGGRSGSTGRKTLARRQRRSPRRPSPQSGSHAGCVSALDLLQDPIMLGETLRHLGWEGSGGRAAAGSSGEGPRAEATAEPGGGQRELPGRRLGRG